jgi:hypothetical protein
MQAADFIQKWSKANLSEQAASQEHFLDLCRLLGVKTPAELDPVGDTFTFEKGATVSGPASLGPKGDRGRADVWYKGRFAWEYKRKTPVWRLSRNQSGSKFWLQPNTGDHP